jgi:tripeptidyl-peptidase-1
LVNRITGIKGCLSYSVPERISDHVEIIKPTLHFDHRVPEDPARLRKRANLDQTNGPKTIGAKFDTTFSLATCDQFIIPECIRALYDFYYIPHATANNSYGIGELLSGSFHGSH